MNKEHTRTDNGIQAWDMCDAMLNAADRWKSYLRTKDQLRTRTGPIRYPVFDQHENLIPQANASSEDTYHYFEKATNFGSPDGLCGLGLVHQTYQDSQNMMADYRLAAYMEHSFAMYRVAQFYEPYNYDCAAACYRQAAKWGYPPAIQWCNHHNQTF